MKFTKVLWLIIIASSVVFPQGEFEFSGYFSEMPVYQNIDKQLAQNYEIKRDIYMNLSRVRLRPVIYFFEDTRVNLEYEAALLAFNSTAIVATRKVTSVRSMAQLAVADFTRKYFANAALQK